MSATFLEGVLKSLAKISNLSHLICFVCTVQYPHGSPLLSPGLQPSESSSGGASMGSSCTVVNSFLGVPLRFLEGLVRNYEKGPRKSATYLLFYSSCDRESFNRMIPFSPMGLLV